MANHAQSINSVSVQWFYKDDSTQPWIPFNSFDTENIEGVYLDGIRSSNLSSQTAEMQHTTQTLLVRGGLYEVNVKARRCYPVYWEGMF